MKKIKQILIFSFVALTLFNCSSAGKINKRPVNVSTKLISKSELPTWIKQGANLTNTKYAAQSGNPVAQRRLGRINSFVYKNSKEAIKWYKKSASKGDAIAQNNLGVNYENGIGVRKNYKKAVKWYKKAANQGDESAQNNLGIKYRYGQGVTKNYKEALRWFLMASDQGNSDSQYSIGNMYYNGQGVSKNYKEALNWFHKSADQGNSNSQNAIGTMYDHGYGVSEDENEAVKWFRKSAIQGNAYGQKNLAWMYDYGKGLDTNWNEAVYWYKKAANQGNTKSQRKLGEFYLFGVGGVSKDITRAKQLFKEASKSDDKLAKQYIKVINDIENNKYYDIKTSNYGNKISVDKSHISNDMPWIISKYGATFRKDVHYSLGQSTSIKLWPTSAESNKSERKFYDDELKRTGYSPSDTFFDKEGVHKSGFSYKKDHGYRGLGYFYFRAYFHNPDEKVVIKVPAMICWKPKNEY